MAESMQGLKRTHRCGELSAANIGETVTVMGWVQKNRNKGGLDFVDVRDRSGIIQAVFEEGKTDSALLEKATRLRAEYVVAIVGKVERRQGAVNTNISTGEIEIIPEELRVLSEAETPPFQVEENSKTKEEVRLKYRYLDLRRPDMQRNLLMRSRVATLTRQFLADEGFLEIETPVLVGSTPEGARDYLVPSRIHHGHFYALPQSPQLFKQLLMCSGCDRYFQLAKCFRDEDLRADRQPEFTQIDMELSFVDVDDVIDVNERLLEKLFRENYLEFHPLFSCETYVYLWKGHPLAGRPRISIEELKEYPCLMFDQGSNNSFFLAEEMMSTYDYKRSIRANDRATMLNLMVGLNGYTLCSGKICEELNGDEYRAVPLKETEEIVIGYVQRKGMDLSLLAQQYLEEIKKTI